jgi:hypothetical protein
VAGRARGRMEFWQKWSFPFSPLRPSSGDPAGWRPVRKRITWFSPVSGQIAARGPEPGQQPRCEVDQATAALVFAQTLPGMEPGPDESRSYAEWLSQRPVACTTGGRRPSRQGQGSCQKGRRAQRVLREPRSGLAVLIG